MGFFSEFLKGAKEAQEKLGPVIDVKATTVYPSVEPNHTDKGLAIYKTQQSSKEDFGMHGNATFEDFSDYTERTGECELVSANFAVHHRNPMSVTFDNHGRINVALGLFCADGAYGPFFQACPIGFNGRLGAGIKLVPNDPAYMYLTYDGEHVPGLKYVRMISGFGDEKSAKASFIYEMVEGAIKREVEIATAKAKAVSSRNEVIDFGAFMPEMQIVLRCEAQRIVRAATWEGKYGQFRDETVEFVILEMVNFLGVSVVKRGHPDFIDGYNHLGGPGIITAKDATTAAEERDHRANLKKAAQLADRSRKALVDSLINKANTGVSVNPTTLEDRQKAAASSRSATATSRVVVKNPKANSFEDDEILVDEADNNDKKAGKQ